MREGWKTVILEEVAEVVGGGTPSTREPSYWGGDVRWITPSEITAQEGRVISKTDRMLTAAGLENSSAKLLPPGTVLLTSRATIGAVALAGAEMATNQGFASLVPRRDVVLPHYLMYWCQLNKDEFIRRAGGNTFKEVSKKKVASVPLSIPPLEEQRRIVDLISSIDQAIRATEELELTSDRGRAELIAEFASRPWPRSALGDAAEVVMGQSPPGSTYNTGGSGMPFLQGSAEFGRGHPHPEKWCTAPKKTARTGDVLISVRAPVGAINIAHIDLAIGRGLAIVRGTQQATEQFLALALEAGLNDLEARAGGGMFTSITKKGLISLPIMLPSLSEQQDFVESVMVIDRVVGHASDSLARLKTFRKSVVSDLLIGEHEIPDSYDRLLEDAS